MVKQLAKQSISREPDQYRQVAQTCCDDPQVDPIDIMITPFLFSDIDALSARYTIAFPHLRFSGEKMIPPQAEGS